MSRPVFERTKPHRGIAVIGEANHGKSTLCAVLSAHMAETWRVHAASYRELSCTQVSGSPGAPTVSCDEVWFEGETDSRHYAFVDCPGHADYVRNAITGLAQADAALLVAAADEGITRQTREHLL